MEEKKDNKFLSLFMIIVLMLTFFVYFQSIGFDYVLDDKIVLSENNFVKKGLSGIWDILTTDSFQGYFGEQKDLLQGGRYRPLSLVTFAVEYQFFGLNPKFSHFFNILLYGLSVLLIFSVCRYLLNDQTQDRSIFTSIAGITAFLFLLHPTHVEAVANIKGRDEIMALGFSLLSLLSALKFYDLGKFKHLTFTALFFFLGLLSKENTLTFFAVIPLAIVLFRKLNRKKLTYILTTLIASVILYFIWRMSVIGFLINENPSTDIMNNPYYGVSANNKFATILYVLYEYLRLSFVPHPLTHDYYPYHIPIVSFGHWKVIMAIILHAALVVLALLTWRKKNLITFSIAFYFITLSIISNIIVDVGTFMNERFLYMPTLGICLLIASLLKLKLENKDLSTILKTVILLGIAGFFFFKSYTRVPVWQSELTLNQAAIKVSKNSARANSFMATALFNKFKSISDHDERKRLLAEAKPYAEKAVEIYPNYFNAHLMRSGIAAEQYNYDRDIDKLLYTFEDIIKTRPNVEYVTTYLKYLNGLNRDTDKLIEFYTRVGIDLLQKEQKNYGWSAHYLLIAHDLAPNNKAIRKGLIDTYNAMNRPDLAEKFY